MLVIPPQRRRRVCLWVVLLCPADLHLWLKIFCGQIVHPTFVANYHFLKQIWLLLKRLKPFLTNFNTSCHLFTYEQMWYLCRWHMSHSEILYVDMINCRLENVCHVLQILNSHISVFPDHSHKLMWLDWPVMYSVFARWNFAYTLLIFSVNIM